MKNNFNSITYRISEIAKYQQEEYKNSLVSFLMRQDFNYFITLNFFVPGSSLTPQWLEGWAKPGTPQVFKPALNDAPVSYETARKAFKRWQAQVDREFLGRMWSRQSSDDRLFFFAFPELGRKSSRTDSNLHYHLLARVPYAQAEFVPCAKRRWENVCPSGQADIQKINNTNDDHFRTRSYATKCIMADDGISHFIISTEFQT